MSPTGGQICPRGAQVALQAFALFMLFQKESISSVRPSDSETTGSTRDNCSDTSSSNNNSSSYNSISEWADQSSTASYSPFSSLSLPQQRFQALNMMNQALLHQRMNSKESIVIRSLSCNIGESDDDTSSCMSCSDVNDFYTATSSFWSLPADNQSYSTDSASASDFSSVSQVYISFELEKLRIELRHLRGMYAMAQSEAIDASKKLNDLNKHRLEETIKLKEITLKEEEAKQLAKQEKEKSMKLRREKLTM
ncbi:hypothetical protein M9H77_10661 [Catharanthus roseus]|uniref:Uncharacterized protein n=1 Tax=Catharanthus roseus TaxID=4058 RepID=A0ACC0BCE5_CATRO|nr:hypothetical protein M9H77_10661 [Catharanthus roseus]